MGVREAAVAFGGWLACLVGQLQVKLVGSLCQLKAIKQYIVGCVLFASLYFYWKSRMPSRLQPSVLRYCYYFLYHHNMFITPVSLLHSFHCIIDFIILFDIFISQNTIQSYLGYCTLKGVSQGVVCSIYDDDINNNKNYNINNNLLTSPKA